MMVIRNFVNDRVFQIIQGSFYLSILASNLVSIIVVAQAFDRLLILLLGQTLNLQVFPHLTFQNDLPIGGGPSSNTQLSFSISLGYLLTAAFCIPLSLQTMEENMRVQYISFAFLCTTLAGLAIDALTRIYLQTADQAGTSLLPKLSFLPPRAALTGLASLALVKAKSRKPIIPPFPRRLLIDTIVRAPLPVGKNFSELLSTFLASYSYVNVIPSWANEMEWTVNVARAITLASVFAFVVYYVFGFVMSWAYPLAESDNILGVVLEDNHSPWAIAMVYAFDLITVAPGILVYCITTRYNLLNSKVCHRNWAIFWSVGLPFCIAWLVCDDNYFSAVLSWSALVFSLIVNFIAPNLIYLVACNVSKPSFHNPRLSRQHPVMWHATLQKIGTAITIVCVSKSALAEFAVHSQERQPHGDDFQTLSWMCEDEFASFGSSATETPSSTSDLVGSMSSDLTSMSSNSTLNFNPRRRVRTRDCTTRHADDGGDSGRTNPFVPRRGLLVKRLSTLPEENTGDKSTAGPSTRKLAFLPLLSLDNLPAHAKPEGSSRRVSFRNCPPPCEDEDPRAYPGYKRSWHKRTTKPAKAAEKPAPSEQFDQVIHPPKLSKDGAWSTVTSARRLKILQASHAAKAQQLKPEPPPLANRVGWATCAHDTRRSRSRTFCATSRNAQGPLPFFSRVSPSTTRFKSMTGLTNRKSRLPGRFGAQDTPMGGGSEYRGAETSMAALRGSLSRLDYSLMRSSPVYFSLESQGAGAQKSVEASFETPAENISSENLQSENVAPGVVHSSSTVSIEISHCVKPVESNSSDPPQAIRQVQSLQGFGTRSSAPTESSGHNGSVESNRSGLLDSGLLLYSLTEGPFTTAKRLGSAGTLTMSLREVPPPAVSASVEERGHQARSVAIQLPPRTFQLSGSISPQPPPSHQRPLLPTADAWTPTPQSSGTFVTPRVGVRNRQRQHTAGARVRLSSQSRAIVFDDAVATSRNGCVPSRTPMGRSLSMRPELLSLTGDPELDGEIPVDEMAAEAVGAAAAEIVSDSIPILPVDGAEDAFVQDENLFGEVGNLRIHVFPAGWMRRNHVEITVVLLLTLTGSSILTALLKLRG